MPSKQGQTIGEREREREREMRVNGAKNAGAIVIIVWRVYLQLAGCQQLALIDPIDRS